MKAQAVLGALFIQPYVIDVHMGLGYGINKTFRVILSVVVLTF